jgi:hypothetical protein
MDPHLRQRLIAALFPDIDSTEAISNDRLGQELRRWAELLDSSNNTGDNNASEVLEERIDLDQTGERCTTAESAGTTEGTADKSMT